MYNRLNFANCSSKILKNCFSGNNHLSFLELLVISLFLLVFFANPTLQLNTEVCGGHFLVTASDSSSGILKSPNYPFYYNNLDKCIWALESESKSKVFQVQVENLNAEPLHYHSSSNSNLFHCNDYLEIRNGNSSNSILFKACAISAPIKVQSTTNKIWLKFYSNYAHVNRGFLARWTLLTGQTINSTAEYTSCIANKFCCPNKQCLDFGYVCDGVQDCGCNNEKCDEGEYYCKKWTISILFKYGVTISIGFSIFILFCAPIGVYEFRAYKHKAYAHHPQLQKQQHYQNSCSSCHTCLGRRTARVTNEEEADEIYQRNLQEILKRYFGDEEISVNNTKTGEAWKATASTSNASNKKQINNNENNANNNKIINKQQNVSEVEIVIHSPSY